MQAYVRRYVETVVYSIKGRRGEFGRWWWCLGCNVTRVCINGEGIETVDIVISS